MLADIHRCNARSPGETTSLRVCLVSIATTKLSLQPTVNSDERKYLRSATRNGVCYDNDAAYTAYSWKFAIHFNRQFGTYPSLQRRSLVARLFESHRCNDAELRQIANDASASSYRSGNLQGVRASTYGQQRCKEVPTVSSDERRRMNNDVR